MRKVIHIDMDCFYAAVEVRDNPALAKLPVAVAWSGPRSVVLTANYAARAFGVRSAMVTHSALRRCPQLTLVTPRFEAYRVVSRQIHAVFGRYTDLIEPLSLDEAYLDVTAPKHGPPSATRIAELIRRDIRATTGLTASAGVSTNKFLAKLASGMHKPDGLTVILPNQARALLEGLPVEAFHGIGPATARKLHALGVSTGAELRELPLERLQQTFGKLGMHFYHIARGVDERPVEAHRPYKSVSAETTFANDLNDIEGLVAALPALADHVADRLSRASLCCRAVVVKLKYRDFRIISRRRTLPYPITRTEELAEEAARLLRALTLETSVRLLGVRAEELGKVSAEVEQPFLFSARG
jgi:DNA polymerase-4